MRRAPVIGSIRMRCLPTYVSRPAGRRGRRTSRCESRTWPQRDRPLHGTEACPAVGSQEASDHGVNWRIYCQRDRLCWSDEGNLAERVGFEPTKRCRLRHFQCRALGQTRRPLRAQPVARVPQWASESAHGRPYSASASSPTEESRLSAGSASVYQPAGAPD
jgi:hypothetical protein